MAVAQTVSINFLANATQAQTAINTLHRNLGRLQNQVGGSASAFGQLTSSARVMTGAIGAVSAAYVTLTMAMKGFGNAFATNLDAESTMLRLKAVVQEDGGDIQANMDALKYKAQELGRSTRYSFIEAAAGMEYLAKAGKSTTEVIDMINPTLNLATLSNMELADASEKLADIMSAFGAESAQTAHYVDTLALTAAKSTTDVSEMVEAFKYVSAAAGGMGQSFEMTSALIGAMANKSVKASMAGTAIRGTLVQLADAGSMAVRDLQALGLSLEEITPSATNQLVDIMQRLRDRGVDASNAYAIFGQRAGVAANVFTQFYEEVVKFNGVIDNAEGAAQRMADTMDSGLEGAMRRLKNSWAELMRVMGEGTAMNVLTGTVRKITSGILMLTEAVEVFKNAFADGALGELLFTSLKWAFMKASNELYNGLTLVFSLAVTSFLSQMELLTDPAFWEGMFNAFAMVGALLMAAGGNLMAALMEDGGEFTVLIASGLMFAADKMVGGLLIGAGAFGDLILTVAQAALEKFRAIAEYLGMDVDAAIEGLTGAKVATAAMYDEGIEMSSRSWADTQQRAAEAVGGMIDGLREGAENNLAMAEDAMLGAKDNLMTSLQGHVLEPLADVIASHNPSEIFAMGDIEGELAALFAKYRPVAPPTPEGEAGGVGGTNAALNRQEGAIRALAGANAMAVNAIMGRTANEFIAQSAAKQVDIARKTLDESKRTNEMLREIKDKRPRAVSVFD